MLGIGGGVLVVAIAGAVVGLLLVFRGDPKPVAKTSHPTPPDRPTAPGRLPPPPRTQPTPAREPEPPQTGGRPADWSAFQGEGFHVDVPNGSDFRHDPRPSDIPFFGERQKIWTSHKAATPGQPVYRVSVVKLTRAQQDEYKKNPDQAWKKVVRIEDGLPASDFQFQSVLTLPGGEGREYTFPVGKDLHGFVRFLVMADAGWVYSWSLIANAPVSVDQPMVKPFLDSLVIDRTPLPFQPKTPPTTGSEWKEIKGDGFVIRVPPSDDLFERKSGVQKGMAQSVKVLSSVDPKNPTRHTIMLSVQVWDLTPAFTQRLDAKPDAAWDDVFKSMKQLVMTDFGSRPTMAEGTLDGRAGREMVFLDEGIVQTYRFIAVNGKMYVVHLDRFTGDKDDTIMKCFDSFKLTR